MSPPGTAPHPALPRTTEEITMTTPQPLAGVLPVVQTPFTADGDIDLPALGAEIEWVLDQGVAGITTGMVSEILRLTESERRTLAEAVVAGASRRGAVSVIACGAESTRTAVSHARHAEQLGATAVMAIPPVTVALSDDAMFGYYAAIAESVGIGLIVQDASGYIGRSLSIGMQARLLDTFGEQIAFKPEADPIGPRLTLLRDATDGRARAFEGSGGAALVDSFRRGVVGTMPGSEVCWAIQAMWDALQAGDWDTAYAISGPLNQLVSLETSIDIYVAIEKHLLSRQGVLPSTAQRSPLQLELDRETREEVDRLFDRISAAAARPAVAV